MEKINEKIRQGIMEAATKGWIEKTLLSWFATFVALFGALFMEWLYLDHNQNIWVRILMAWIVGMIGSIIGTVIAYGFAASVARTTVKFWWYRTAGHWFDQTVMHETLTSLAAAVDVGPGIKAPAGALERFHHAEKLAQALGAKPKGLKYYIARKDG